MSVAIYILGIVAAALALGLVIELLRKRSLRERHAIWWLIASVLALLAAVFPAGVIALANAFGVQAPSNLVFFVSIVILFLVCIQHSSELTKLEDQTRTLAERVAILELELRTRDEGGAAARDGLDRD